MLAARVGSGDHRTVASAARPPGGRVFTGMNAAHVRAEHQE
ncbi:hypothetical protein [Streptomyces spiramyceticus]|nr:hypothetical protein [Streptomyces spiramyceticus]